MTYELRYADRVAAATTTQGLDPVLAALTAHGIAAEVEDTGGLTLAAVAPVEAGVVAITHIGADLEDPTYLVGTYAGADWHDGSDPVMVRTVTGVDVLVTAVQAGHHRLRTQD